MMHVTFSHVEDITPTIKTFWFKPARPVRYIAGQFTELHLPHEPSDDRGIRRWFTLSSSPTENLLAITTNFASSRSSSFKKKLLALQPGTQLHLADPMGDFVLPKDQSIPILFVAAGLGITPVRSMIKWLHDRGEQRDIRLLYAVNDTDSLAFASLFTSYGLEYIPIVKQRGESLDTAKILQSAGGDRLIYLSGPEPMVEKLYTDLVDKGVRQEQLAADYFHGYQAD